MVKNVIPKPHNPLGRNVAKHAKNAERAFDALFDFKPIQDKDLFWQPGFDKETNPFVGSHPLDDTPVTPARPVTKQRTIQELKEQFEEGTKQERKDKWVWRPPPSPFPNFPTEPQSPFDEPDIPVPPQDKPIDDPFHPADESPEAEEEGEDVKDPPRDRFDQPPVDCQQLEMLGIPCTKANASLQIQTSKFRKNGPKSKTYRKSSHWNNSLKKSPMVSRRHTRRQRSGLRYLFGL